MGQNRTWCFGSNLKIGSCAETDGQAGDSKPGTDGMLTAILHLRGPHAGVVSRPSLIAAAPARLDHLDAFYRHDAHVPAPLPFRVQDAPQHGRNIVWRRWSRWRLLGGLWGDFAVH